MTSQDAPLHTQESVSPPPFDAEVPPSGYRWWYVDGMSADGRHSLVVIAFVGSVFSPYYFRARKGGPAEPENHCAINVGLYMPERKLWVMTEHGRGHLERDAMMFRVAGSTLTWRHGKLVIDIDERSAPFRRPVRGQIVVTPDVLNRREFNLNEAGGHRWWPYAPLAHIEVEFSAPAWAFSGDAYIDTNSGDRPLETDFTGWNWSRSSGSDSTLITYATEGTDGQARKLALEFRRDGYTESTCPPPIALPLTGWRVPRDACVAPPARVTRTLEDTPFYSRSLIEAEHLGDSRLAMHESLSLTRFRAAWVRQLLPFRMPRID